MFRGLSKEHGRLVLAALNQASFTGTPRAFRGVFGITDHEAGAISKTIQGRMGKINTIENVARDSLMIRNRLVYGTGFRADLITLTHVRNVGMKGTNLARLLCANNSTVSRILIDLKASRFLEKDGERAEPFDPYPGMYISVLSVWNLCELIDASQFSLEELKLGTLDALNFKQDGFGRKVAEKVF